MPRRQFVAGGTLLERSATWKRVTISLVDRQRGIRLNMYLLMTILTGQQSGKKFCVDYWRRAGGIWTMGGNSSPAISY